MLFLVQGQGERCRSAIKVQLLLRAEALTPGDKMQHGLLDWLKGGPALLTSAEDFGDGKLELLSYTNGQIQFMPPWLDDS
eukprot:CAMPEP_0171077844 /NCGR_PEP_ID=MMETSP0766_2-20121228/14293_1 /TAXON_ID=439317 /ORGANISM="Gambierdiscus australes, Strain CAWD 149" /LENGTH=79 /DNA_ID=CAMNT_0011534935 /DNA_START=33 /DNA_END=272 /DNA_ORIENTATION=+